MDEDIGLIELGQDLDQVPDVEILPTGDYPAEVLSVEGRVSGKGNPYFAVVLQVAPDDYPAGYDEGNAPNGTKLYNNVMRPGDDRAGLNRFRDWLKAIGVKVKGSSFDPNQWIGKSCRVTVRHGSDQNGNARPEIAKVSPLE